MRKLWKRALMVVSMAVAVITFRLFTESSNNLTTEAGDPLRTE